MRASLLFLAVCLAACSHDPALPYAKLFSDDTPDNNDDNNDDTEAPDTDDDGGDDTPHHPDGYAEPNVHGTAAKLQEEACVSCHGATLEGDGDAVSCDSCHDTTWRTDCTFCHGGDDNSTGAPPAGIAGADPFGVHTWHVTENRKPAYGCVQCHVMPADVLSSGHLFVGDTTPGVSEVNFTGGLSAVGTYDGAGSCSNLYCHGNGLNDNGQVTASDGPLSCDSCHPYRNSGWDAWSTMSGSHAFHIDYNQNCGHCHDNVNDRNEAMARPDLHVDGEIDRVSAHEMNITEEGCTGTCHEGNHTNLPWE